MTRTLLGRLHRAFLYPESASAHALAGTIFGVAAVALVMLGNPLSTGLCASCFLVNIAGALRLHAEVAQSLMRPELVAALLGAFFAAFLSGEFRARGGGRTAFLSFVGGAFLLWGCEVFIGCPIKALSRVATGGAVAVVGLGGLVVGVFLATIFLRDGFSLPTRRDLPEATGFVAPFVALAALLLLVLLPGFFVSAQDGGGTHRAPFALAAAAGLLFGAVGQRSRFCVTGSVRTAILARDFRETFAPAAFLLVALAANAATGAFIPSVSLEPGAHTDFIWAFLSLAMVGFGAVLIGGCPFRQIILSASGNVDAVAAVVGMLLAAGLSVSLGIGSTPDGVSGAGKVAVLVGWAFFLAVGLIFRSRAEA